MAKNICINTKQIKITEEPRREAMPFTGSGSMHATPQIPSKFVKGEFKESDYESDYDHKIAPIWRPNDSDSEPMYYKPIRPVLTPTGRQSHVSEGVSPIGPPDFEQPLKFDGPPRPKFQPIEKPKPIIADPISRPVQQQQVFKPKPLAARPYQPAAAAAPPPIQKQFHPPRPQQPPPQYYTAVAGPPQHIATETKNQMHMRESTESSHRVVNMTQTKRVIQFDARKTEERLEPFPYTVQETNGTTNTNMQQRFQPPPTPTKFIPSEFRDTDYESEVESTRIRPLWTPNPSDSDEPQYRRVNAPQQNRSASVPRSYGGRVQTPMEFDTKPIELPTKIVFEVGNKINKTQTLDRYSSSKKSHHLTMRSSTTRDDIGLTPAPPPQYGFMEAVQQKGPVKGMHTQLANKAQQFMNEIETNRSKSSLKKTVSDSSPQAYRDESRVSQYGK